MATEQRIKRLRVMMDQIERLPPSPERDRLLSEVRSRAVDVDTGVTPRAVLPMREPFVPDLPRPRQRDTATRFPRVAPQPPAPAADFARPASVASRFPATPERFVLADERLSLEDPLQLAPLPHVRGRGDRAVPPWTLGLRG